MRALICLLPLVLSACIQETRVFAGPQTPVAGVCGPPSRTTLTRRGAAIVLAPGDSPITLQGQINGTSLSAQSILPGADKKPYPIVFTGQLQNDRVTGTLTTPRCRYSLALELTAD